MKKIGIGYENYKEFIDQDMYYVDKTLLIKDILEIGGKTTLFTRPRRFGKTLALSMLRTFFELEYAFDGNIIDKREYFEEKKIMDAGADVLSMMGKYPVIKLSLKSAKQPDFYSSFIRIRDDIVDEFSRHSYLRKSNRLDNNDIDTFERFLSGKNTWYKNQDELKSLEEKEILFREEVARYAVAIKTLSELLNKHHEKKVIILIDEYDVPLENAYYSGFYPEMVSFIRSLFESALKTNDALERAVVTGCLRISKESIFTGLNNLQINSVRSRDFGEFFGFTQSETEEMLKAYDLADNIETVRDWYDGYLFGETEVYNPWSVIKYVSEHIGAPERFPEPYWSNTSSNSIIKDLVEKADERTKEELDLLIRGGSVEKKIHEDITYEDIYSSGENLWNFLFFTGYLKKGSERFEDKNIYLTLTIPNKEVGYIYENKISDWFDNVVNSTDRKALYDAIINKDTKATEDYVSELLMKSISTFDSAESFYHGFFLSLLHDMPKYSVRSNREEGLGRPDIVLYPLRPRDPAYIFEIKTRDKFSEMNAGLEEAFTQIRNQKYEEGILSDGYASVVSFGVCFCRKSCVVGMSE